MGNSVTMNGQDEFSLRRYVGDMPKMLLIRILLKICIAIAAAGLSFLRNLLLSTTDRSALTSGDLRFIVSSLQGWLLLLIGVVALALFVVIDIIALIILSSRILHQEPVKFLGILKESFGTLRRMLHPKGILFILYCVFLVPLTGVGFQISYTSHFYIPDFITSVIQAHPIWNVLYTAALFLTAAVTIKYLFTFHYMIFEKEPIGLAMRHAGIMMKRNWKNFAKRYIKFSLRCILVGLALTVTVLLIFFGLGMVINTDDINGYRFWLILFSFIALSAIDIYNIMFVPFQMLAITRIYESYTEKDEGEIRIPSKKHYIQMIGIVTAGVMIIALVSAYMTYHFEEFLPTIGNTEIVVHRGGGNLSGENTVSGILKAYEAGAEASEIDVQRTKDGYYILNHDKTFRRLAGVNKTPSEMTLSEIKELTILETGDSFSTMEEVLDASKGKIHIYVELKGSTADAKMAEDLYEMAKEREMLPEVTFVSLKYPVISGLEREHPNANTGYLCYAGFGNLENLEVDELILEEETASDETIEKIHDAGKRVAVWTVNNDISMLRFYTRRVDAIVTDDVTNCLGIRSILRELCDEKYGEHGNIMTRVALNALFVWGP